MLWCSLGATSKISPRDMRYLKGGLHEVAPLGLQGFRMIIGALYVNEHQRSTRSASIWPTYRS